MLRAFFFSSLMCAVLHGALAERPPIDAELEAETVLVITPLSDDSEGRESETFLGEASLFGTAETVLESGVRLRGRFALRLQKDHPQRPGGSGGFGNDTTAAPSAFSGLSDGPVPTGEGDDLRARLETAYIQVDGGYGELRIGKDSGVAARFYEGAPSVFSHTRGDTPLLDATGLTTVRTRHDLTGPSAKVSYATPRLLGVRAGLSFTPEADADGLDRRPSAGGALSAPEIKTAVEMTINATRTLRDSGLRFDAAVAWSTANVSPKFGAASYGDMETLSAGLKLDYKAWSAGISMLSSDNGLSGGDYTAWNAGLMRESDFFDISFTYGEAEDDSANLDGSSWRLGVGKDFDTGLGLAVAYVDDSVKINGIDVSGNGIVVEMTLSSEIFSLTSY
ncbi:MAG: porin [Pseudomonadota bacterium]